MPKKKRVFKTYETKITSKSKKGKLKKEPLVKIKPNHMVKVCFFCLRFVSLTEMGRKFEDFKKKHNFKENLL